MKPPAERELRNPYYLLRTPDELGSYLKRNNYKLIMSEREPLSRFLAPIKTKDEGKSGVLEYDLENVPMETIERMETVPESVRAAFEQAAEAFYSRCDEPEGKVSEHERRLRRGFRLPDPDIEPDAYWLYGPRENRRLLILWGCEFQKGRSLPLKSFPGHDGPGVLEKLNQRSMPWQACQKEMLGLLKEKPVALSRFIATPVVDEDGNLSAVEHEGEEIPLRSLKRLKRLPLSGRRWLLLRGEIRAFQKAAAAFYKEAHPDAEGLSDYEKALRTGFKLPDPEKLPDRFYRRGSRLVIVADSGDDPEKTLHLAADKKLSLPRRNAAGGRLPPTLAERLEAFATPVKRLSAGGVAAAAAVLLAVAWWVAAQSHPEIESVEADGDPEEIFVRFDKPLNPGSLQAGDYGPSDPRPESFRLRDGDGRLLRVTGIAADPANPARVRLQTEPLIDDREYELVVAESVTAGRLVTTSVAPDTTVSFRFSDTIPPRPIEGPGRISAPQHRENAGRLYLVFDKPLSPDSVRNHANYVIPGFRVRRTALHEQFANKVVIDTEEEFEYGADYAITITGVAADTSVEPEMEPFSTDFTFAKTRPPRLNEIVANIAQTEIELAFNERLEVSGFENTENFRITAAIEPPPEYDSDLPPYAESIRDILRRLEEQVIHPVRRSELKEAADTLERHLHGPAEALRERVHRAIARLEVPVRAARLHEDGQTASIHAGPLWPDVDYRLDIDGVTDVAENPFAPDQPLVFQYEGDVDTTPPAISSVRASLLPSGQQNEIEIEFDKPLDPETARLPAVYTIGEYPCPFEGFAVEVENVEQVGSSGETFMLHLSDSLVRGRRYTVEVNNVGDIIGNMASSLRSVELTPPGASTRPGDLRVHSIEVAENGTRLTVMFNTELASGPAENTRNYCVGSETRIVSAELDPANRNRVTIEFSPASTLREGGHTLWIRDQQASGDSPDRLQADLSAGFRYPPGD